MNKLTALILSATLSLASGAALAAETNANSTDNNGPANAAASAGVGTPEANQNIAPKGVDSNDINTGNKNMSNSGTTGTNMGASGTGTGTGTTGTGTGGTMLHPDTSNTNSATSTGPNSADEIHKNTQCKDGKCPDINDKVETGQGGDNVNPNTDGTTH